MLRDDISLSLSLSLAFKAAPVHSGGQFNAVSTVLDQSDLGQIIGKGLECAGLEKIYQICNLLMKEGLIYYFVNISKPWLGSRPCVETNNDISRVLSR